MLSMSSLFAVRSLCAIIPAVDSLLRKRVFDPVEPVSP
jgi:hypothetical protein